MLLALVILTGFTLIASLNCLLLILIYSTGWLITKEEYYSYCKRFYDEKPSDRRMFWTARGMLDRKMYLFIQLKRSFRISSFVVFFLQVAVNFITFVPVIGLIF